MSGKHIENKKSPVDLILLIIAIICILLIFYILFKFYINQEELSNKQSVEVVSVEYSEELEEIKKIEEPPFELNIEDLETKIKEYIGNKNISVSYYNTTYNKSFNISGDIQYHPASTAKLYMVLALYDAAHEGILNISDMVYYQKSDYEAGTGILQSSITVGKGYSLKTLSEYAIKYSDNIAYKMIRRKLGKTYLLNYCSTLFGRDVGTSIYNIKMSSNDAMAVLTKLYENKDNNELYLDMIDHLKNTVFSDRLAKYLPEGIVAHKIGTYSSYVHDAGIIYSDSTYIISVYTKNDANSFEDIAQISKLIYEWTIENDNL